MQDYEQQQVVLKGIGETEIYVALLADSAEKPA
jgi:hypothetical protein